MHKQIGQLHDSLYKRHQNDYLENLDGNVRIGDNAPQIVSRHVNKAVHNLMYTELKDNIDNDRSDHVKNQMNGRRPLGILLTV